MLAERRLSGVVGADLPYCLSRMGVSELVRHQLRKTSKATRGNWTFSSFGDILDLSSLFVRPDLKLAASTR